MQRIDLRDAFSREIEVLELNDDYMIYALDQKNEIKDICCIERMDFNSRKTQRLLALDYTRLWESFRTYGQMPDFFYAVNVLADYRLRLRKINKKTWEICSDLLIRPEGEIINIYSLNEDYLIITDEVKADEEIIEKYGLKNNGHRYINIRYLYEINTARKYPIRDSHFDSLTEDIPVCMIHGEPSVIYETFYREESMENGEGMSEIGVVSVDGLIAHIKDDGLAGFKVIAHAKEADFDYVRRLKVSDDTVIYRRRRLDTSLEEIVEKKMEHDGSCTENVLATYCVPDQGEIFYDLTGMNVYWCPEEEDAPVKTIRCLNAPEVQLSYDGKYGKFSALFKDELLVTVYYDEIFVKEYEYHEYVALHDLKSKHVETVAGRMEKTEGSLVLLRSFLAL